MKTNASAKQARYEHEKRDLKRFAAKIAAWARDGKRWDAEGNHEMAKVNARDTQELTCIYNAIQRGDYQSAAAMARRLDTIVRDQIPVRLYNAINQ